MNVHLKRAVLIAAVLTGGCGMAPDAGEEAESRQSAITFSHLGSWSNTGVTGGPEVGEGTFVTRKDGTFWAMATSISHTNTPHVFRKIWSTSWGSVEQLSDTTFDHLNTDGQGFGLHAYLGTSNTTDRNVVYAYAGTDNQLHYGQVKSSVTAAPYNFSRNLRAPPAGVTFDSSQRPAIATSGTCGTNKTCLYLFVLGTNANIYFKHVGCPTSGDCDAFTTTTTDWSSISTGAVGFTGGLAAAQVTSNKIMVLITDSNGTTRNWNITASTGAVSSVNFPPWPITYDQFKYGQTMGATSYSRGTSCAQIVAADVNDELFSTETCDGVSFQTWTDIGAGPSGTTLGGKFTIAETFPAASPKKFDVGVLTPTGLFDATDW